MPLFFSCLDLLAFKGKETACGLVLALGRDSGCGPSCSWLATLTTSAEIQVVGEGPDSAPLVHAVNSLVGSFQEIDL